MSDDDMGFSTLADMGFPYTPEGKGDWLYIAGFDPTITDQANLVGIASELSQRFGDRVYEIVKLADDGGNLVRSHLLIADYVELVSFVNTLLWRVEQGERVDERIYQEMTDAVIQRQWHRSSMLRRLALTREATIGPAFALDAEVPEDVSTMIYQGTDWDSVKTGQKLYRP